MNCELYDNYFNLQNQLYMYYMYSSHVINCATCFGTPHVAYSGVFVVIITRRLADDGTCGVPEHVGKMITCEE